jgi:hypothetical protein
MARSVTTPGQCSRFEKKMKIGGFHVYDSAYCSCAATGRSFADLAVQQILGLLPQWWSWFSSRDFACTGTCRTALKLDDVFRSGRLDLS